MTSTKTLKLVTASLLAALTCIATMIIQIPTPVTSGYIHLGDGFVILSGLLLGPANGALAAGIGSMLADLLSGYAAYAPVTLVIKALAGFAAGLSTSCFQKKTQKKGLTAVITGGICAAVIVALGYFTAESTIMGYGLAAAASIPHNFVQGIFGILVSAALYEILSKIPSIRSITA